ncbi:MAG: glucokinase [Planctomycetes bacterium]|nr:glucokinase [Planctomycetota bacterium]
MILAGDVGGTKTVLGLFDAQGDHLREVRSETYASREHQSLEEILALFLKGEGARQVQAACFGVAGPVIQGQSRTTNLPWHLEEKDLGKVLGDARAKLLNDLEAMAFGMLYLRPEELCVLNPGTRPGRQGNIAVIAAGTGLGEAMLYWDGERHHPLASEGGHADFAPRTDQEIELLRYLRARLGGRVSYERVLSGPGLFNIYSFLRETGKTPEPSWLTEQVKSGDPNAVVTQVGLARKDPVAREALELFGSIYGAEAGNLALKCMALGGVFVGGGIAPRILPVLQGGTFMGSLVDKGRLADLLKSLEVSVDLNPRTPLIGAAHYGLRL